MTTKDHQRTRISVQVETGEPILIGTVTRPANGQLNPYELAAFFRAAADEIERTAAARVIEELIDEANNQRWRREEAEHHDGQRPDR